VFTLTPAINGFFESKAHTLRGSAGDWVLNRLSGREARPSRLFFDRTLGRTRALPLLFGPQVREDDAADIGGLIGDDFRAVASEDVPQLDNVLIWAEAPHQR
jgi:hypothetical protein